ncbi:hypothetical protein BGZ80_011601 [Entomortierella chlamydospora]|uniref:Uncharacterized protein n=1 Tax=Entomortierella chlamydospora TaxID=101097 RepID=A0A9P6SZ60_9FUNG|nr:hypothetical protein BGZ80_011601 [Entomortierella chlamydospora]
MHHPGVVLEVVLSTMVEHVPQGLSTATLSLALTDGQDNIPSTDLLLDKTIQGFQNTVIRKLDAFQNQVTALHSQAVVTQQITRKVCELQKQTIDRLAMIHHKTDAIMAQNFNLAEYDIPRLFIVLPETSRSWDPASMFRTKFRLRFICMGVEHFERRDGIILPKLHLAMHEGYVIKKPTELFKKYRPLLTAMLKMAGNFVPVVSAIDAVTSKGIEYSLKCLETTETQSRMSEDIEVNLAQNNLTDFLTGVREVDGPDLRLLRSYLLETSSGDPLGNMYRITTHSGYVKWVCHDCLML